MHKKITFFALVTSFVMLTSCNTQGSVGGGGGSPNSENETNFQCTQAAPSFSQILRSSGFIDLKNSCIHAGGIFQKLPSADALGECLCPGGGVLMTSSKSCETPKLKFIGGEFEKFCLVYQPQGQAKAEMCFGGSELAQKMKAAMPGVASGLSLNSETEPSIRLAVMPSLPAQAVHQTWLSNAKDVEAYFQTDLGGYAKDQIETPGEVAFPHTGAGGMVITSVFYEPEASRIPMLLSNVSELSMGRRGELFDLKLPPTDFLTEEATEGLESLRDQVLRGVLDHPESSYRAQSEKGCSELCTYSRSWKLARHTGKLTWEKTIAGGGVLRNQILLRNEAGMVTTQVLLTPADTVSLVFIYQFDFINLNIQRAGLVFDRLGKLVHKKSDEHKVPVKLSQGSYLPGGVVVCESGFPSENSPEIGNISGIFRKGPVDQSIFGWVDPKDDSLFLKWSGVGQQLLRSGMPYYASTEHALSVSRIANQKWNGREMPVIPIGLYECMEKPGLWSENLPGDVKVVNLSSVFSFDRSACRETPLGRTILNSSLLWVVGAGNGGEQIDLFQSRGCPANLGPLDNLIVVAASYHGDQSIASSSTYGKNFADIVAPGNPYHTDHTNFPATSLATPRVSAAAAEVVLLDPMLTPAEIRMAVLTSVDIPESWSGQLRPVQVRSGGFLNRERALQAGRLLKFHPRWVSKVSTQDDLKEMKGYFRRLYGNDEGQCTGRCNDKIESRMKFLVENGVIQNAYCP